jgi:hypothetical protein
MMTTQENSKFHITAIMCLDREIPMSISQLEINNECDNIILSVKKTQLFSFYFVTLFCSKYQANHYMHDHYIRLKACFHTYLITM